MTSIKKAFVVYLTAVAFCLGACAACNMEKLPSEKAQKEDKAQRDKHKTEWLKADEARARGLHRAEWPGQPGEPELEAE